VFDPATTPSKPNHIFDIPNRRLPFFVGREDVLSRLETSFKVGPRPCIALIRGTGDQGKSQVALEFCRRTENKPYSAVIWASAKSIDSVHAAFAALSERIKAVSDVLPDTAARIEFVLRKLGE
jgi:ATP/maltotriose-dependent transcriptional regulator MalT